MSVSNAFQVFMNEAPEFSQAWMEAMHKLDAAGKLDKKTSELAYIAVLAALKMDCGMPFHVKQAKALGATREEIISAILVGLPAAGHGVVHSLPPALTAFDCD